MSFVIPQFPLVCAIHTGGVPYPFGLLRSTSPCNLAWGKRVAFFAADWGPGVPQVEGSTQLLLPAHTDIRDSSCTGDNDYVEVPSGSGRWYAVLAVDDVGKGFPNEHRVAVIAKAYQQMNPTLFAGLQWPTPIP